MVFLKISGLNCGFFQNFLGFKLWVFVELMEYIDADKEIIIP